jgi:hypothetical protein
MKAVIHIDIAVAFQYTLTDPSKDLTLDRRRRDPFPEELVCVPHA